MRSDPRSKMKMDVLEELSRVLGDDLLSKLIPQDGEGGSVTMIVAGDSAEGLEELPGAGEDEMDDLDRRFASLGKCR